MSTVMNSSWVEANALLSLLRSMLMGACLCVAFAMHGISTTWAGPRGEVALPGPLRSGHEDMSLSLQALQADTGLNPAWLWIEQGRAAWVTASATQRSCASCHGPIEGLARSAATHPRWHAPSQRPRTLDDQVLHCRRTRQSTAQETGASDSSDDQVLRWSLSAALVAAAAGQTLQPDLNPHLQPWVERGQQLWQQRMGQLNLSCAQCHDHRAGQRLGGTRIPQGHDTGYPLYRMEWQGLGSLERRLRGCMSGIRAEPFAPGADEWRALALYMHRRSAGLRLEAGAIRP